MTGPDADKNLSPQLLPPWLHAEAAGWNKEKEAANQLTVYPSSVDKLKFRSSQVLDYTSRFSCQLSLKSMHR
jgi:hypothetical protein